jgi:energy-coupling factor transporter ATP-binding protein EcfA2
MVNKLLSTYGLTKPPFTKDIPPAEMFQTEALQQAQQSLKAALEARSSAVVTGDSGCGKTCLLRALEQDLPPGRYRLHYVHNATVNRRDFYRQLSLALGLEPRATFAALFATVSQHIEEMASQHKLRVALVLDEGHMLPIQVLEQLHILLNFEQDSKPWLSNPLAARGICGFSRPHLRVEDRTPTSSFQPNALATSFWSNGCCCVILNHKMTVAGTLCFPSMVPTSQSSRTLTSAEQVTCWRQVCAKKDPPAHNLGCWSPVGSTDETSQNCFSS